MADFEANFTLEQQPTIEADFSMTVINTDHDALTNRDMADQHPISAITGLQDALDSITSDMVTEQELSDALATKQDTLTAGTGISIENGVISSTQTSAEWGNIGGKLSDQTDLNNALDNLSGGIDSNHQAISSINQTISAYGNIVTHNTSEFATASQGDLADTAVQPSSLATVATSGSYNDLSNKPTIPSAQVNSDWNASSGVAEILNKPTIPTVNDATITFTQGGTTKGSFTLNQASNQTIALDAGGSTPANMVTTNTDQDITGIKTFVGEKRIKFKQSASGNKLGFTLYDNNNKEAAAFEYRPNTINSYPLLYLGQYKGSGTSYISTPIYVGFRSYDWDNTASYNLVAPLAKDAKSSFSLNGLYKTFYLPLGVTDGNTTVTTGSNGVLDISSLLSGGGGSYTAGTGIDITSNTISVDSTVVTTNTAQTITGTKTFEGNQWITKFKNTSVAYNVAPVSGDVSTSIAFVDMYDNAMGTVDCWRYRDNSTEMDFGIFAANGAWISSTLKIYADANGNASAHAPTPAVGSNGDNIATTAWVNTAISGKQDVSNLVTSVSSSSTDSQYPSAKLFYDTCGNIETLINAL